MTRDQFVRNALDAKAGNVWLDPGPRAIIVISGSDRERFLNGQLTAKITGLPPGIVHHTGITDAKGRLQGDGWVHHDGEVFFVDVPLMLGCSILERLQRYIIADDVHLQDQTSKWRIFHRLGEHPDKTPTKQVRSSRYGEAGYDLWFPAQEAPSPVLALPEVTEAFRIAAGFPAWEVDMNASHLAPEALPSSSMSADKGCYIGQEVISRIRSVGRVNKRLFRLVCEHESWTPPPLPCVWEHKGQTIATLTSAARAIDAGWQVLAWVPRDIAEKGPFLPNPFESWKLCAL